MLFRKETRATQIMCDGGGGFKNSEIYNSINERDSNIRLYRKKVSASCRI